MPEATNICACSEEEHGAFFYMTFAALADGLLRRAKLFYSSSRVRRTIQRSASVLPGSMMFYALVSSHMATFTVGDSLAVDTTAGLTWTLAANVPEATT